MRKAALVALTLGLLVCPAAAEEKCQLVRIAALDMGTDLAHVTVPAAIGDQPLTMIVDTGGVFTSLSESKAATLGLHPQMIDPGSTWLSIYGGIRISHYASVSDFTLGRMKARKLDYPLLPFGFFPPGVDGLLAQDFLANFDLDFDFANAKLNLFSKDHCKGRVIYWTHDPVATIPFTTDEVRNIYVHVQLDGHDVKAQLDTGSPRSAMSLETAEYRYNLDDASPLLTHVPGPNGTKNARHYPFKQLLFDGVTVANPDITLVPDREAKMGPYGPDLIIGMSILRQLHLYVAYGEKNLYVTAASTH